MRRGSVPCTPHDAAALLRQLYIPDLRCRASQRTLCVCFGPWSLRIWCAGYGIRGSSGVRTNTSGYAFTFTFTLCFVFPNVIASAGRLRLRSSSKSGSWAGMVWFVSSTLGLVVRFAMEACCHCRRHPGVLINHADRKAYGYGAVPLLRVFVLPAVWLGCA